MSSPAPTPDWDSFAALRPRLAVDTRISRHCYRGVTWYIVQDGASSRHLRLGEGAWRIAGLMDGERSLECIHRTLVGELGEAGPAREELVRVLCDLHSAELLECPELTDARQIADRQRQHRRMRWRRLFSSPVSQRIPLVNPQSWLDRWLPTVRPIVSRTGFLLWALVALAGLAVALMHWQHIAAGLSTDVLRPHSLALILVAYISMKTLHELGHAFATRAFGGQVHEMGVMFLVFIPVPYIDASAASAFVDKNQRMAVDAAGIMVEVFLSVVALAVWLAVEPGLVRDLAFNMMLVGGLSTLLFNGNPLLRFDGYYLLCDALEIPNLGARSTRYLGYLVQRHLCGAQAAESPVSAPGEPFWFVLYGISSTIYRVAILIAIVLFVAQGYPVIGMVLGAWVVVGQLLLPAFRGLARLVGAPVLEGRRSRAALVLGGPALIAAIVAFVVPLPAWTYAEGIVWLPERAQLRAGADGFFVRQIAAHGTQVKTGDPLFALDSEKLRSEVTILELRLEEHQAEYDSALFHDRGRIEALEQRMARVRSELENARERAAQLLLRSPLSGTLVVPDARRLDGRYLRKGEMLGYVTDGRPLTTRVAVNQQEIDRVREDTRAVWVKLPGYMDRTLAGHIESAVPSATRELPAAALGVRGGGRIPVVGNPEGRTTAESVFVLDVILPADAPRAHAGARVYLRFEHARSPLAAQLLRGLRQLLLARFGV